MQDFRHQPDYHRLFGYLTASGHVSRAEAEAMLPAWQPLSLPRKSIITAAGEPEPYLYFVLEGVQRAFYLGERERQEATLLFSYPPSFSGVADAFLTQTPSAYFLETLTASRFLRLPYPSFKAFLDESPGFQRQLLHDLSGIMRGLLERQVELQCFTAEEKFRTLLRRSPHILQLVPHKYLASYLGLDPSTFSKLMGSVRAFEEDEPDR